MIKKFLIILSVLIFAFGVLSVSVFKASAKTLAAIRPVLKLTVSPSLTAAPTPKSEIQYYLPYPGILPDHPLYPLKMIRDRIWLWFTTDSLKKAEVLLLFADKRLGAGKALIEGNKLNLGFSTLEKAEKYLERVVEQLETAKKKGKQVRQTAEKLKTAAAKHQEVLTKLGADDRLLSYPKDVTEAVRKILELTD